MLLPDDCGQEKREHRYRRLERRGVGGVGVAEAQEEEELVPENPAARLEKAISLFPTRVEKL